MLVNDKKNTQMNEWIKNGNHMKISAAAWKIRIDMTIKINEVDHIHITHTSSDIYSLN